MEKVKYPLEYIRWVDSCVMGGGPWHPLDEMESTLTLLQGESVGWIIRETDEVLIIVAHITEGEQGAGGFAIPKAAVRERKTCRLGEPMEE